MMEDLSDQELLTRYATAADQLAFREVVERHLALVYQCAYRHLLDSQLSEDVTQRVFGLLARKASRLSRHPALLAWLHQTTRFVAARQRRSEQRQAAKINALANRMTAEAHSRDPWTLESRSLLDEALAACLRDQERHVLLMHFVEGRSYKEIGLQLGKSEAASRTQACRALAKVSEWFKQRGYVVSAAIVGGGLSQPWAPSASAGLATGIVESISTGVQPSFGMVIQQACLVEQARVASFISLTVMSATLLGFAWQNYQSDKSVDSPQNAQSPPESGYLTLTRKRSTRSELLAVLESDPDKITAEQLVRSSLENTWTGRAGHDLLSWSLRRLSEQRLFGLLEEVDELPRPENVKGRAKGLLLSALGHRDPRLGCELALQYGRGSLNASFRSWLRKAPVDAVDWLEQLDDGQLEQLDQRTALPERYPVLREAAVALIPVDQERAFAFLERVDDHKRDLMLGHLGLALIENGTPPLQAFRQVQQALTEMTPTWLADMMALRLADRSRRDAAAEIVESVYGDQPEDLVRAMLGVVGSVIDRRGGFRQEAEWLVQTLPQEILPEAVEGLTNRFAGGGEEVTAWIASLPEDSGLRDHALLGVVKGVCRSYGGNPTHAQRALTQIQNAEIREKAEIAFDRRLGRIREANPDWDLSNIKLSLEP